MKVSLTASTWDFIHIGGRHNDPAAVVQEIYRHGLVPELWLAWGPQPDCYDRGNWEGLREIVRPSPALSFHTRNDRQRMLEEIELLAYLGGRVLVVHPVVVSLPGFPERKADYSFIRELAAAARERGVLLALENIHGRGFLDDVLGHVETFDDRGGLGICIDIGHAELRTTGQGGFLPEEQRLPDPRESAVQLIRDYGPLLLHLHIHDVAGEQDHRPLGTGFIDYSAIAAALRELDFQGAGCIEIRCDEPVAMLDSSIAYLRNAFGSAVAMGAEA